MTSAAKSLPKAERVYCKAFRKVLLLLPLIAIAMAPESGFGQTGLAEPGSVFRDCDDCPEMVVVPPGRFLMGSPDSEAGRLQHEGPRRFVTISKPIAVSRFEVTFGQYARFVDDTGHDSGNACVVWTGVDGGEVVEGRNWLDPNFQQAADHPVVCISWNDARAYIDWLGRATGKRYRFLSESEWEYMARAGTTTRYFFGDSEEGICDYANVPDTSAESATEGSNWQYVSCDDGYGVQTAPVGSYAPNTFGLYDVHGNVWEWTEDCYHDSFTGAPTDGAPWLSGECETRVVRGGSLSAPAYLSRSAVRFFGALEFLPESAKEKLGEFRNFNLGLRVARGLE